MGESVSGLKVRSTTRSMEPSSQNQTNLEIPSLDEDEWPTFDIAESGCRKDEEERVSEANGLIEEALSRIWEKSIYCCGSQPNDYMSVVSPPARAEPEEPTAKEEIPNIFMEDLGDLSQSQWLDNPFEGDTVQDLDVWTGPEVLIHTTEDGTEDNNGDKEQFEVTDGSSSSKVVNDRPPVTLLSFYASQTNEFQEFNFLHTGENPPPLLNGIKVVGKDSPDDDLSGFFDNMAKNRDQGKVLTKAELKQGRINDFSALTSSFKYRRGKAAHLRQNGKAEASESSQLKPDQSVFDYTDSNETLPPSYKSMRRRGNEKGRVEPEEDLKFGSPLTSAPGSKLVRCNRISNKMVQSTGAQLDNKVVRCGAEDGPSENMDDPPPLLRPFSPVSTKVDNDEVGSGPPTLEIQVPAPAKPQETLQPNGPPSIVSTKENEPQRRVKASRKGTSPRKLFSPIFTERSDLNENFKNVHCAEEKSDRRRSSNDIGPIELPTELSRQLQNQLTNGLTIHPIPLGKNGLRLQKEQPHDELKSSETVPNEPESYIFDIEPKISIESAPVLSKRVKGPPRRRRPKWTMTKAQRRSSRNDQPGLELYKLNDNDEKNDSFFVISESESHVIITSANGYCNDTPGITSKSPLSRNNRRKSQRLKRDNVSTLEPPKTRVESCSQQGDPEKVKCDSSPVNVVHSDTAPSTNAEVAESTPVRPNCHESDVNTAPVAVEDRDSLRPEVVINVNDSGSVSTEVIPEAVESTDIAPRVITKPLDSGNSQSPCAKSSKVVPEVVGSTDVAARVVTKPLNSGNSQPPCAKSSKVVPEAVESTDAALRVVSKPTNPGNSQSPCAKSSKVVPEAVVSTDAAARVVTKPLDSGNSQSQCAKSSKVVTEAVVSTDIAPHVITKPLNSGNSQLSCAESSKVVTEVVVSTDIAPHVITKPLNSGNSQLSCAESSEVVTEVVESTDIAPHVITKPLNSGNSQLSCAKSSKVVTEVVESTDAALRVVTKPLDSGNSQSPCAKSSKVVPEVVGSTDAAPRVITKPLNSGNSQLSCAKSSKVVTEVVESTDAALRVVTKPLDSGNSQSPCAKSSKVVPEAVGSTDAAARVVTKPLDSGNSQSPCAKSSKVVPEAVESTDAALRVVSKPTNSGNSQLPCAKSSKVVPEAVVSTGVAPRVITKPSNSEHHPPPCARLYSEVRETDEITDEAMRVPSKHLTSPPTCANYTDVVRDTESSCVTHGVLSKPMNSRNLQPSSGSKLPDSVRETGESNDIALRVPSKPSSSGNSQGSCTKLSDVVRVTGESNDIALRIISKPLMSGYPQPPCAKMMREAASDVSSVPLNFSAKSVDGTNDLSGARMKSLDEEKLPYLVPSVETVKAAGIKEADVGSVPVPSYKRLFTDSEPVSLKTPLMFSYPSVNDPPEPGKIPQDKPEEAKSLSNIDMSLVIPVFRQRLKDSRSSRSKEKTVNGSADDYSTRHYLTPKKQEEIVTSTNGCLTEEEKLVLVAQSLIELSDENVSSTTRPSGDIQPGSSMLSKSPEVPKEFEANVPLSLPKVTSTTGSGFGVKAGDGSHVMALEERNSNEKGVPLKKRLSVIQTASAELHVGGLSHSVDNILKNTFSKKPNPKTDNLLQNIQRIKGKKAQWSLNSYNRTPVLSSVESSVVSSEALDLSSKNDSITQINSREKALNESCPNINISKPIVVNANVVSGEQMGVTMTGHDKELGDLSAPRRSKRVRSQTYDLYDFALAQDVLKNKAPRKRAKKANDVISDVESHPGDEQIVKSVNEAPAPDKVPLENLGKESTQETPTKINGKRLKRAPKKIKDVPKIDEPHIDETPHCGVPLSDDVPVQVVSNGKHVKRTPKRNEVSIIEESPQPEDTPPLLQSQLGKRVKRTPVKHKEESKTIEAPSLNEVASGSDEMAVSVQSKPPPKKRGRRKKRTWNRRPAALKCTDDSNEILVDSAVPVSDEVTKVEVPGADEIVETPTPEDDKLDVGLSLPLDLVGNENEIGSTNAEVEESQTIGGKSEQGEPENVTTDIQTNKDNVIPSHEPEVIGLSQGDSTDQLMSTSDSTGTSTPHQNEIVNAEEKNDKPIEMSPSTCSALVDSVVSPILSKNPGESVGATDTSVSTTDDENKPLAESPESIEVDNPTSLCSTLLNTQCLENREFDSSSGYSTHSIPDSPRLLSPKTNLKDEVDFSSELQSPEIKQGIVYSPISSPISSENVELNKSISGAHSSSQETDACPQSGNPPSPGPIVSSAVEHCDDKEDQQDDADSTPNKCSEVTENVSVSEEVQNDSMEKEELEPETEETDNSEESEKPKDQTTLESLDLIVDNSTSVKPVRAVKSCRRRGFGVKRRRATPKRSKDLVQSAHVPHVRLEILTGDLVLEILHEEKLVIPPYVKEYLLENQRKTINEPKRIIKRRKRRVFNLNPKMNTRSRDSAGTSQQEESKTDKSKDSVPLIAKRMAAINSENRNKRKLQDSQISSPSSKMIKVILKQDPPSFDNVPKISRSYTHIVTKEVCKKENEETQNHVLEKKKNSDLVAMAKRRNKGQSKGRLPTPNYSRAVDTSEPSTHFEAPPHFPNFSVDPPFVSGSSFNPPFASRDQQLNQPPFPFSMAAPTIPSTSRNYNPHASSAPESEQRPARADPPFVSGSSFNPPFASRDQQLNQPPFPFSMAAPTIPSTSRNYNPHASSAPESEQRPARANDMFRSLVDNFNRNRPSTSWARSAPVPPAPAPSMMPTRGTEDVLQVLGNLLRAVQPAPSWPGSGPFPPPLAQVHPSAPSMNNETFPAQLENILWSGSSPPNRNWTGNFHPGLSHNYPQPPAAQHGPNQVWPPPNWTSPDNYGRGPFSRQ